MPKKKQTAQTASASTSTPEAPVKKAAKKAPVKAVTKQRRTRKARVLTSSTSPTAPELLATAAGHINDRKATYDADPSDLGERSMAKTVAMFNVKYGTSLTEAQGWDFMVLLKGVRQLHSSGFHSDSAEDKIAYTALEAEALARAGQ